MAQSFLSRAAANTHIQLAATAIVSGAVVAGAIIGYQQLAREERVSRLKESIPALDDKSSTQTLTSFGTLAPQSEDDQRDEALARRAQAGDYDDDLILEQLARNRVFLKPEGLEKLRASFVVVVGCGGVGSHCAAAFARSGVSKIRLVDFDQVSLSSLNRHAVATLADVGSPKVQCLQKRLLAIAPWVHFDMRVHKFDGNSADRLLAAWSDGQKPDFVIDAIDNIDTKVALLKYCHDNKLPVISAMGAGTKSDPTKVTVGDISESRDDSLSRATRRRLKLLGITSGIPTVFSTEKTGEGKAELLPLPEEQFQKGKIGELGPLADFRVRILPVLGTMPAVFGYTVANHVILSIAGYPIDYASGKGRDKLYDQLHAGIQGVEEKITRAQNGGSPEVSQGLKLPITNGDVAFLAEDIFQGRSAISRIPTRLALVRWRKPLENTLLKIGEGSNEQKSVDIRISDLVCMTKNEAAIHVKEVLLGDKSLEELYDTETIERVEMKLKEAETFEKYR